MAKQKIRIPLPKNLSDAERAVLGQKVAEFIRERTRSGVGFRKNTGRNYNLSTIPYTEEYADRKGVSQSDVDLTDKGDMLDSLHHMPTTSRDSVTVGVSDKENGKAEGNAKVHGRPFLGLLKRDLERLMGEL